MKSNCQRWKYLQQFDNGRHHRCWLQTCNKVCEDLRIQNLGEHHGLLEVQCGTLLLVNVFESFCNKCIKIYELNAAYFLSALGLVWQVRLKKTEAELKLLAGVNRLLVVEKGIRGEICQVIHRNEKANSQ